MTAWLLNVLLYALLLGIAIAVITPFYLMIASSFRPEGDITSPSQSLVPNRFVLENYSYLLKNTLFTRWFANTVIVAGGMTILGLFLCSLGGFGFAKYNFRGRDVLFLIIIGSVTIPQVVTIVPVFAMMAGLGLLNTYWVLILPHAPNAFGLFFMRQYISSVPDDMIEAARIDGCSEFRIYWQIVLPVIKPALGALSILLFLHGWMAYLWPLVMTNSDRMLTVPVGIATMYNSMDRTLYGSMLAAAAISTAPILIVFLLAQKAFIAGLTIGATKG